MAEAQRRPVGIMIVSILAFISGVIDIITGIFRVFEANNPDINAALGGPGGAWTSAIGSIVLGAIVVVLAYGLWLGRWVARMIITVLQVLTLLHSLFLAVAYIGIPVGEWASVFVSAVVLILMWTRSASAYFRPSEVAAR